MTLRKLGLLLFVRLFLLPLGIPLCSMCGRPLGCKNEIGKSDGQVDCGHVSGLLTRRHDRWPGWGAQSSLKQ
jgi:hypothetical protein